VAIGHPSDSAVLTGIAVIAADTASEPLYNGEKPLHIAAIHFI
jgi:hypothetical protein